MSDPKITGTSGSAGAQPITPAQRPVVNRSEDGQSFADALKQVQQVRFSNHAQKRLENRDIQLTDDGLARLNQAVDKADRRGGRDSLVLMDDLAFIVNVKDRLVVTAVDPQHRGEGVFTQIDSVVIADPSKEGTSA
jgi:flagellar operon protein